MNLSYQIWIGFIFVYKKSIKRTFKTGFWVEINSWICVLELLILKGYSVVKKLWNVRIKAFWYTKSLNSGILLPDKFLINLLWHLNFRCIHTHRILLRGLKWSRSDGAERHDLKSRLKLFYSLLKKRVTRKRRMNSKNRNFKSCLLLDQQTRIPASFKVPRNTK